MNSPWVFDEEKFIYRELGGEYVILNLNTEHYYSFDEVGSFVFSLMLRGKTISEIEDAVLQKYKTANEKMVKKDVRNFIRQLQTKEIICAIK